MADRDFTQRLSGPNIAKLIERLEALPRPERVAFALRASSKLLEFTAFELAQSEDADRVAELIVLAAEMERTARTFRKG